MPTKSNISGSLNSPQSITPALHHDVGLDKNQKQQDVKKTPLAFKRNVASVSTSALIKQDVSLTSPKEKPLARRAVSLPSLPAASFIVGDEMVVLSPVKRHRHSLPTDLPELAENVKPTPSLTLPSVTGLEAVATFYNQGIPESYLKKLGEVALEMGGGFSIRPVDKMCRTLIEENYPSKGLAIKGKSANWGPQAGFIPVKQQYSKLAGAGEEKINAFQAKIETCIAKKEAKSVQLSLSTARLEELERKGIIQVVDKPDARTKVLLSTSPEMSKTEMPKTTVFTAKQDKNEAWQIFVSEEQQEVPLHVLANEYGEAMTADFDLLESWVPEETLELGGADKMKDTDVSPEVVKEKIKHYKKGRKISVESLKKLEAQANPKHFYERFNTKLGNISQREEALKDAINAKLNRGEGRDMVHHGTDVGNPATDSAANYPATYVIGKPVGPWQTPPVFLMVQTQEEHVAIRQMLRDESLFSRSNPLWDKRLTNIRSSRFNAAMGKFNRLDQR